MRIGLDTTVLVRLLIGEPAALARTAALRVQAALERGDEVLVSDLVVAEAYFALHHHYGLTKGEALESLRELLGESGIKASGASRDVLETPRLAGSRPGFVDRMIHAEYTSLRAVTWTFERAASRLSSVEILGA